MKGNALVTNIEGSSLAIAGTDNRVDESNIAAFVEMAQQFGSLNIGVGLRYEHVKLRLPLISVLMEKAPMVSVTAPVT